MSNELQQAVALCGSLAKQYRGVLALADAVGRLGDLDSHRLELEKKRDEAQSALDGALASLTTAKAVSELQQAKEAAESALAAARADTARERHALAALMLERATAGASVKGLKVEAAEVEEQLTTMRADISAMKQRFG